MLRGSRVSEDAPPGEGLPGGAAAASRGAPTQRSQIHYASGAKNVMIFWMAKSIQVGLLKG